jgi:hypothetical protein
LTLSGAQAPCSLILHVPDSMCSEQFAGYKKYPSEVR